MSLSRVFTFMVLLFCSFQVHHATSSSSSSGGDYKQALTNSLLYFEGQRSGKLPSNQRVNWRGDSALQDGEDAGVIFLISFHIFLFFHFDLEFLHITMFFKKKIYSQTLIKKNQNYQILPNLPNYYIKD